MSRPDRSGETAPSPVAPDPAAPDPAAPDPEVLSPAAPPPTAPDPEASSPAAPDPAEERDRSAPEADAPAPDPGYAGGASIPDPDRPVEAERRPGPPAPDRDPPEDGRALAPPRRRWLAMALSGALLALGAGGVLVALTFDRSTVDALVRVGPGIVLVLAGLTSAGWLAAAARIHVLTRSLGHRLSFRDSFAVAVSGEFGVAASPTGLGGTALRLAMLRARGVPLTAGTAVVGADLVLDGGVAILITVVALPLAFLFPGTRSVVTELAGELDPRLLWAAGGLLLLVLAAGLAWRGWSGRRNGGEGEAGGAVEPGTATVPGGGAGVETGSTRSGGGTPGGHGGEASPAPGLRDAGSVLVGRRGGGAERGGGADPGARGPRAPAGWWAKTRRHGAVALHRVRSGMATLFRYHPRTVALGFLLALFQILCRYSILPVVVTALAGPTNVFALYPLQGLLNFVAHLVVLPGGGGSVELGAGVVLALFVPASLVGAAVLLWRLFTFHWNLFAGGAVFFLTLARERRRLDDG